MNISKKKKKRKIKLICLQILKGDALSIKVFFSADFMKAFQLDQSDGCVCVYIFVFDWLQLFLQMVNTMEDSIYHAILIGYIIPFVYGMNILQIWNEDEWKKNAKKNSLQHIDEQYAKFFFYKFISFSLLLLLLLPHAHWALG